MSSPITKRQKTPVEWWIAKVPEFVLKEWDTRASSKPNDAVAKLHMPSEYNPNDLPKRLTISSPGTNSSELEFLVRPEYLPGSSIQPPSMLIVSDPSSSSKQCSLEGRAALFADVRPGIGSSASYQALIDERKSRYEADLQTQKIVLEDGSPGAIKQFKLLSGMPSSTSGRSVRPTILKRADRAVDKRVRIDEMQLKSRLFVLFDSKPHYRLSELVQLTDQPKAYLKEVLDQICTQHRTGPNMHHYSLKANYRLTTDVEESAT
uniref:TFIIF beta subunit HTH domain-containing protein n=1 Tax=Spongospora subterranea TaxID=70186 RepID=A0A0H5R7F1_9EUKA|eukprot:CRZ10033.1 hypothetical protein [Spongospora subterranea]